MGLFDVFSRGKAEARKKTARAKELAGDLEGAVSAYLDADFGDEAARVLLLRADAEKSVEKRLAFCASAVGAATSDEMRQKARARKALLGFDLLKAKGGSLLTNEILLVARELEEAGELEKAADAFQMAGDADSEVRTLTAAGSIERLEERLRVSEVSAKSENERTAMLRKIADHDRTAERRFALEACEQWLTKHHDEKVAALSLAIRARLLRGPVVDLVLDGERLRFAFGSEVSIGRGDATLLLSARAVSRKHVRIFRGPGGAPFLEDLGTRNGTTLAGARLSLPVPIGSGITVKLGNEVPCSLKVVALPGDLGASTETSLVSLEMAAETYLLPLGPLRVFGLLLDAEHAGFVTLRTPDGSAAPLLNEMLLSRAVELCSGDAIALSRGTAPRLRVPGDQPRTETSP